MERPRVPLPCARHPAAQTMPAQPFLLEFSSLSAQNMAAGSYSYASTGALSVKTLTGTSVTHTLHLVVWLSLRSKTRKLIWLGTGARCIANAAPPRRICRWHLKEFIWLTAERWFLSRKSGRQRQYHVITCNGINCTRWQWIHNPESLSSVRVTRSSRYTSHYTNAADRPLTAAA